MAGGGWARVRRGGARGREGALALALAEAVGAADAQLLSSVFLGLQQAQGWAPPALGGLALAEGLASAVAGPAWQRSLGRWGGGGPARALGAGCICWGLATALCAAAPSFAFFLLVRAMAAAALAAVPPAASCFFPEGPASTGRLPGRWEGRSPRGGDVFGEVLSGSRSRPWLALGQVGGGLAGGVVAAVLARGEESGPRDLWGGQGWRFALLSVAGMCVPAALASAMFLPREVRARAGGLGALERKALLSSASPAFVAASLQMGLNAVPRSALLFSTMWLQLRGLSDGEASACSASLAVGHAVGSFAGQHLGDLAVAASPGGGRVALAQLLDALRVAAVWTVFRASPARPGLAGAEAALAFLLLGFLSACMEMGVSHPLLICSAPAQVGLAGFERALRGLWSALFGAPLVGYIAQSWLGYHVVPGMAIREMPAAAREKNATALGTSICTVACAAWAASFVAATPLYFLHRESEASVVRHRRLAGA